MLRLRCRTSRMSIAVEPVTNPNFAAWLTKSAVLRLQISFLLGRQSMFGQGRRSICVPRRRSGSPISPCARPRAWPPALFPQDEDFVPFRFGHVLLFFFRGCVSVGRGEEKNAISLMR